MNNIFERLLKTTLYFQKLSVTVLVTKRLTTKSIYNYIKTYEFYLFWVQEELCGIEPRRRMRNENPACDARLLREAYARTTRRPHTETFAEKVVCTFSFVCYLTTIVS